MLAKARNVQVPLAEVVGLDTDRCQVILACGGVLLFDQVVLATGLVYNHFAYPEWKAQRPAPKTIADARLTEAQLTCCA